MKIVGLDWERDGWRVSYDGKRKQKTLTREELLDESFDGYDLVIVEQAHMRERNVYSVAQVYSAEELSRLACRDKIKLFPGMPGQLARAARAVGNVTDEVNEYGQLKPNKDLDASTVALWAKKSPERVASWKPYRPTNEDPSRWLWPLRDALRNDIREALNPLRVAWNAKPAAERYALPEVKIFCDLLDRHFDNLTDGVKEQFGIRRSRNGIRVERMSAAITVFLMVASRDGRLRVRPDGGFIGIRFILDAIGMSSSYRPNMARSQLTHHGMRHYKGGRDGGSRSEYMFNLRHFMQFLRDSLIVDSGLDSLTQHSVLAETPTIESLMSDSVFDTLTDHSDHGEDRDGDSLTRDSGLDSLTRHSVPVPVLEGNS